MKLVSLSLPSLTGKLKEATYDMQWCHLSINIQDTVHYAVLPPTSHTHLSLFCLHLVSYRNLVVCPYLVAYHSLVVCPYLVSYHSLVVCYILVVYPRHVVVVLFCRGPLLGGHVLCDRQILCLLGQVQTLLLVPLLYYTDPPVVRKYKLVAMVTTRGNLTLKL